MHNQNYLHILITAYAVNPYKGSEEGTGWHWVCQAARYQQVTAITRHNNRPAITQYCQEHPGQDKNITWLYYDLPLCALWLKKLTALHLVYAWFWHLGVACFIIRQRISYDVAHHLNFHNDWAPSFLWLQSKPWVWGPIGHHPPIPRAYILPAYGWGVLVANRAKHWAKSLARWADPFRYLAAIKAHTILCMHHRSKQTLPKNAQAKVQVVPAVASPWVPDTPVVKQDFIVLSVGRFVPLKGFDITINAFAEFYRALPIADRTRVKLVLVGKGPQQGNLQQLAQQLGIDHAIQWHQWMPQRGLNALYRKASLFLFPSHEGAGMVVPEAMSFGLPVLCFDQCGPGQLVQQSGVKIPYNTYHGSIQLFASKMIELFMYPRLLSTLSVTSRLAFEQRLHWHCKGETMRTIYQHVLRASQGCAIATKHHKSQHQGSTRYATTKA